MAALALAADEADEVQAARVGADLAVRVAHNRYLLAPALEPKASVSNVR
jgi:hypothetical protein